MYATTSRRLAILSSLSALATAATAGTDLVEWPAGYVTSFVRYHTVDKPKARGPARVRFLYVNPAAIAKAVSGKPLPSGTVLVMEDHLAAVGADGQPLLDANGRFVPTAELTNVFVQEKRTGWGAEYAEEVRNDEWEYAWFEPNGTRKADAKLDGCFACHKGQGETDYNFTFTPFVAGMKP